MVKAARKPRTEGGQVVTPLVAAGRFPHSALSHPLPLSGSSKPGGCAPRAATPLAQLRASYVSLSGPFIPWQVAVS